MSARNHEVTAKQQLLDANGNIAETVLDAFPMGKLQMPTNSSEGDIVYEKKNLRLKYVLEKNPDYLFVVDRAAIAGGTISAKELFDNELMKKTDAYKNGNIIYLNPSIWYTATGGFTSTMKMVEEIDSAIK